MNDVVHKLAQESENCINANAISLILQAKPSSKKNKKIIPFGSVADQLIQNFNVTAVNDNAVKLGVKGRLLHVHKEYIKLVKYNKKDSNDEKLLEFLRLDFIFPNNLSCSKVANATCALVRSPDNNVPNNIKLNSENIESRQHCLNVTCVAVKQGNQQLVETVKKHRKDLNLARKQNASLRWLYKIRTVNQRLKRNNTRTADLKRQISDLEVKIKWLRNKNDKLKEQCSNFRKDNRKLLNQLKNFTRENERLENSVSNVQLEHQDVVRELRESKGYIHFLECCAEGKSLDDAIRAKEKKMFTPDIRMMVYTQLTYDVPVQCCGKLINDFTKIFLNKELSQIPTPSSCAQMSYELGVLSSIQVTEFLLKNSSLCLSWDATTVDGAHVNEIHIMVNKTDCICLDVRHLPGGKASDYVTHITSTLADTAATYAKFKNLSQGEVLTSIHSAITCTLTDRAVVNSCVTRQLRDELESELLQLHCNVHPLDSVARCARTELSKLDTRHKVEGQCLGSNGSAVNLIQAVSVLRFKDGTGDPLGFKSFLREHDLPCGTFIRYVGNRLHVQFHLAGVIMLHHEKLLSFIQRKCTAGPLVRCCDARLDEWIESPGDLLHATCDVFDNPLDPESDNVLSALLAFNTAKSDLQLEAIHALLTSVKSVLQRQLKSYISEELSNPSPETMEKGLCAPSNNMALERTLGLLDHIWRRAPNATSGFLCGKIKSKLNKTIEWLEKKDSSTKCKLITFAVSEAREERAKHVMNKKLLTQEIQARRQAVAAERDEKKKKLMEISVPIKIPALGLSQQIQRRMEMFLEDINSLTGLLLIVNNKDIDYYCRIGQVRLVKTGWKVTVSRWLTDASEASSTDVTSVGELFADAILGNLSFI